MTDTLTTIKPTPTELALTAMWTENTGSHFLDSGGAYGRNWERNQGMDVETFRAAPAVTLDARWFVDITVNAWKWLVDMLDYDPRMQRKFEVWSYIGGRQDDCWLENMESFARAIHDDSWHHNGIQTVNTYNGESWLDSVLQYVVFCDGDGIEYVALQYHGGCDVRGGYTKPRVFQINDSEGTYALYSEGRVSLCCSEHNGQELGEGLDGTMVRAAVHAWESDSSGIEWCSYGGESVIDPGFEAITDEDLGESYVACPTCKSPMTVDVFFGH